MEGLFITNSKSIQNKRKKKDYYQHKAEPEGTQRSLTALLRPGSLTALLRSKYR